VKRRLPRFLRIWFATAALIITMLLVAGWAWPRMFATGPVEAPEVEAVLQAQAELPFQILIPAYLPQGFKRQEVRIFTGEPGPQGQAMAQLVYTHPLSVTLTIYEWIPGSEAAGDPANSPASGVNRCRCLCSGGNFCSANRLMVDNGPLRISAETSDPTLLSREHVQVILTTLSPAGGLLTYSTLQDVPAASNLPPAEEAPVNDEGVQELVLVVSPNGYTPVHFSVKKDIPVRLVFRVLGEVGCGNEVTFQWGAQEQETLVLSGSGDSKTLEFTPRETGQYLFHCPHYIYQGVMSVLD
jgi:hypothetical protein